MSTVRLPSDAILAWLLEPIDPGVRYLALRDLLEYPPDHPELVDARHTAHTQGPISVILNQMYDSGYWVKPGPGYLPKYNSTVWSVITLAQLGASVSEDTRISKACDYVMNNTLTATGQFSMSGAPSGTIDCLQGNLCWALFSLGIDDPRLETAYEWMARSVTGEGIAPQCEQKAEIRYFAGKCGPVFACGANNKQSCAWGGVKVMLAFGQLPESRRTPLIRKAMEQGAEFLLNGNPAAAGYPNGYTEKPSQNWWKFGFPVFYVTDILQTVEALVKSDYGKDHRLLQALSIIQDKKDSRGQWLLEYDYSGKTWFDFGMKKQPNKWVTLRALKVLKEML